MEYKSLFYKDALLDKIVKLKHAIEYYGFRSCKYSSASRDFYERSYSPKIQGERELVYDIRCTMLDRFPELKEEILGFSPYDLVDFFLNAHCSVFLFDLSRKARREGIKYENFVAQRA